MNRNMVVGMVWLLVVSAAMEARSSLPQSAPEKTRHSQKVRARVAALPPNSLVEVRLTDQTKVVGRLGDVQEDGFVLKSATGSAGSEKQVTFLEVQSVRSVSSHKSHKKLVIGLIVVAGVIIAALAVGLNVSD